MTAAAATSELTRDTLGIAPALGEGGAGAKIVDNFDVLAEQSGGTGRLRSLVLELAVRGRLVRQDSNDEPASLLLDRIESMVGPSRRREHEGKAEGGRATMPTYRAPDGWSWARLGQVVRGVSDGTHHTPTYVDSGIPFLSVKDISSGRISFDSTRYISEAAHETLSRRCRPQVGDILICRIGTLGKAVVVDDSRPFSIFVSVGLLETRGLPLSAKYLVTALNSPMMAVQFDVVKAGGSHTQKLNLGDIRRLWVPIPPLAEQERIVARVDQLMALCDDFEGRYVKTQQARSRLTEAAFDALATAEGPDEIDLAWHRVSDEFQSLTATISSVKALRRSILARATRGSLVPQFPADGTTDALLGSARLQKSGVDSSTTQFLVPAADVPHKIPSSWRWLRLAGMGTFLGGGTPSKSNDEFWKGSIPWVSPKDMKRSHIGDAEDHISETALAGSATKLIPTGSLLFVVRGMILAHSFPVALTTREVTVNQDMKALALDKPQLGEYLLLACQAARDRVLANVERSSHGTCRLASDVVENLPIPLPPLGEQSRIVAKVNELMALCDDLEERIRRLEVNAGQFAEAAIGALVTPSPTAR